jgi:hypothetical protein
MERVLYQKMHVVPEKMNEPGPEASILKTLAYFDIFQYPLLKNEIKQFLDQEVSETALEEALQKLLQRKNIFLLHDFYSLQSDLLLAEKRIRGNHRAGKLLPKAIKTGRFLFKFPYVRAIAVSGSLSKNYADEKADLDFFIIAKANRLWMARTIMHIFKKFTFLARRQHFYCMNYYLDEAVLAVEDKNIFTAIEVKTLLPVCGREAMNNFFSGNDWTNEFLPACDFRRQQKPEPGRAWFKKCMEWMFNNKMGDRLDDYLMKMTSRRWKKKEEKGKQNKKGQTMGLVTGKHFARSNPGAFQEKVLSLHSKKMSGLKLQMPQWFDEITPSFGK